MKSKIFIIIDHLGAGGSQRQVIEYLKHANRARFDISVINLDKGYAPVAGEIEKLGFRVFHIRHAGFFNISTLIKLIRIFKKERPDIVQTYLFTADCYGRLAATVAGVPFIISSVRNIDLWQKWHHVLADKMLGKVTDKFTINAEKIRSRLTDLQKIDTNKIITIYNGIDLNRFNNLRNPEDVKRELGLSKDAVIVGMVGRFGIQKDYETFFRAGEEVIKRKPDVYFVAVGDGPTRHRIEASYALRGTRDEGRGMSVGTTNFVFTGHRSDTQDLINAMDICVLSSHYEGCPNVILEYMACSKPVVASDVGGCAELVIDGKTGFIVPEGDSNALADRLILLLEDGRLRMEYGRDGKKRVEERFTSDVMARNTEKLYDDLLKPKIAFILSQFPCYDETFILREMNQLKANGLNFEIYSIKRCRDKIVHDKAKGLIEQTRYLPLFSLRIFFYNLSSIFHNPFSYLRTFVEVFTGNLTSPNFLVKSVGLWPQAVAFAHEAKKDKITHVHGQWATYAATFAFIISKLNKIPFSFTGHAHDIYLDTTMLAKKIREAEFVLTCTADNKRYLDKIAKGRVIVNYHGLDLSRFSRAPQPDASNLKPNPSNPFRILSVGSLLESKGFDILIDACKILRDKGMSFKCTIAGGGALEESLKAQVRKLKMDDIILFTGYITQDKLIPYYKEADVFALPVRIDIHWGIPNVLIEAMAASVPVITTPLSSVTELIEDGKSGFIVPEKDPQALADKLILLAEDQGLRKQFAGHGYKAVEEKFDMGKNSENLNRLFIEVKGRVKKERFFRSLISTVCYIGEFLFTPRAGIKVLMYHRVNDELEPSDLVVDTKTFKAQMDYLSRNGFEVVRVSEMADCLRNPEYKLTGKEIVITFDDGYRDNFQNAYPVLKEYGFPAAIFLTTGMTGTDKKRPRYEKMPSPDMLNWDEAREMAKNDITFGAHTVNHPHLDLIDPEEAKREIIESKKALVSHLQPPTYAHMIFCYPYGDYNPSVRRKVKRAGFDCAFTTNPGTNRPGCDLFTLNRTEMNGVDTLFDFKKKLAGAYDLLHRLSEHRRRSRLGRMKEDGRKMSVVNVLYVIWSLGLGGAEQVVINLAKNQDRERFNPIVCCLNDKGKFADELEKEGINVIALNKRGKIDISIIPKLISVMKNNHVDVVNTHLWGANFWGRIAGLFAGVKVVIATEHNTDTWKTKAHLLTDRLLSRLTDRVITVSKSVKDFYLQKAGLDPEKTTIIYNGIDITKYEFATGSRSEFNIAESDVILGIVGRLVPQKGHRRFLSALKTVSTEGRIKGLVVGSGPLEDDLKRYGKELGLNGNLIFTGLRKDVPKILDMIDILVMPSLREGLPVIALEAMAKKKPIVATDVGGNSEVILDGRTGILVQPENDLELAMAIRKLIRDRTLAKRLGDAGYNIVKERFSIKRMVKETENIYEECLNRKR